MPLHKIFPSQLWWPLLIVLFLLAGLTGHDPWKQDETYSFGIIYHFYTTHSWLIPTNAGVPFMEKPPLYYWTAVLFCHLLGGILPLHDAARITSFFYMLLAIYGLRKAAQTLYPETPILANIAVALCLGSIGMVRHAHDMFTDVAQFAGISLALYGMSLLLTSSSQPLRAGLWLGIGTGIAFLSKGLFVPTLLGITFILLYIILPTLRRLDTFKALCIAALVASPFLLLWPIALYNADPTLFHEWFWENNLGRFLGYSVPRLGADNPHGFIPKSLLIFAFPAFPLAVLPLIQGWSKGRNPQIALPFCAAGTGLALLLISASGRALYLMPILPPLALLAATALYALPDIFFWYWNRCVVVIFTAIAMIIWVLWLALSLHIKCAFTHFFGLWLPLNYIPAANQLYACCFAFGLMALWITYIVCKPHPNQAERAGYLWLAAVALVWGTAFSLLMPWIDVTKSYRPILQDAIATTQTIAPHSCITPFHLGESIAPMFEYVSGSEEPNADFAHASCPFILTSTERNEVLDVPPSWKLVWRESRLLDAKNEQLCLYLRKTP